MNTVMLVDDERPARELLKMTIDWERAGFCILWEARNGKQALEQYHEKKPDLIITDIQMPVMDGLEFLEQIKKTCPSQKVVILSCHENFAYARQALKLGVMDYIIKDSLTDEVLYGLLKNMAAPEDPEDISRESPSPKPVILPKALSDISQEQQEAVRLLHAHTIKNEEFFCCTCSPESFTGSSSEWESLTNELQDSLHESGDGEVCIWRGHYLLALCFMKHQASQMEIFNNRFQCLRLIRKKLELLTGCTVSIGVSSQSNNAGHLPQLIQESYQALKSKVFQGTGKNLYYNAQYNRSQSLQLDTLNSQFQKIRSLEKLDEQTVVKTLEQIYSKDLDGIMHYHYLNYVNAVLIDLLMENCQKRNIPYENVFGSEMLTFDVFDNMNSPEALLEWFKECFSRLFTFSDTGSASYSSRIRSILVYIQNNFHHDISLETIANTFWLHKVYLAKIFKQETGKSVNEYIRNLRMEKAKELLLEEHIKINEVVSAVGFNNPQSFYTLFKKYTGMTPKEYRERLMD